MPLKLSQKKEIVQSMIDVAKHATSVLVADTSSIAVERIDPLRAKAREEAVFFQMIRNTLARLVFAQHCSALKPYCKGSSFFAFSMGHPAAAARLLVAFAKENPQLKMKIGFFEGRLLTAEELATIPTCAEALGRLLGLMKELVGGKLARTLMALCLQKEHQQKG